MESSVSGDLVIVTQQYQIMFYDICMNISIHSSFLNLCTILLSSEGENFFFLYNCESLEPLAKLDLLFNISVLMLYKKQTNFKTTLKRHL